MVIRFPLCNKSSSIKFKMMLVTIRSYLMLCFSGTYLESDLRPYQAWFLYNELPFQLQMLLFVVLLSFFYLKQYGKGSSYIEVTRFTSVSNRQNLMHCRVESPLRIFLGRSSQWSPIFILAKKKRFRSKFSAPPARKICHYSVFLYSSMRGLLY